MLEYSLIYVFRSTVDLTSLTLYPYEAIVIADARPSNAWM